jgi:hypothetical protein
MALPLILTVLLGACGGGGSDGGGIDGGGTAATPDTVTGASSANLQTAPPVVDPVTGCGRPCPCRVDAPA